MRLSLFACLLGLAVFSGQTCAPQQDGPIRTAQGDNDDDDNNIDDPNGDGDDDTDNDDDGDLGPQPTQDEHVLGANSAKVTVIEYVDFQCPFCGRFARNTFPTIRSEYIQTGRVKWILRHFPLRSIHPYAEVAAQATECANNQGSFWTYADEVFAKQSELDGLVGANDDIAPVTERLKTLAQDLSLNAATFNTCLDSGSEAARVQRDLDEGTLDGACLQAANQSNPDCVFGTPTFFVNGERHTFQTANELTEIRGWLDDALEAAD